MRLIDIAAFYASATVKSVQLPTEPLDCRAAICCLRDSDGYLLEGGASH